MFTISPPRGVHRNYCIRTMPRLKPKRIIRSGKPAVCPECGNRKFLIVVYGMPTQKVWDDTGRYDCRGCCLPPYVEVVDLSLIHI